MKFFPWYLKYLQISRYRICTGCKGSGSKDPNANTKCSGCNGKGVKMMIRQIQMGVIQQQVTCSDCKGIRIFHTIFSRINKH